MPLFLKNNINAAHAQIIHLSTEMSMGGGEHQLLYLYNGLCQRKIAQTIICSSGSTLEKHCQQHHYSYVSLKRRGAFSLVYAWQLKKILKKLIQQQPIRLIHCHDAHAHMHAILVDILSLHRLRLPLIISKKALPASNTTPAHYFKYRYFSIQRIICVSHAVANICKKWANPNKVSVLYDTLNCRDYLPVQLHQEFTVGFIGTLISRKDPDLFLECAKKILAYPLSIRFWIIGDGPEKTRLEERVYHENLQSHVTFLGYRHDIPLLLSQMDVLLVTSQSEGLCSSILQAMAANVAVVARNIGGIPEIVQHQKNGLLAESLSDFVDNTLDLYHHPEWSEQLRNAAFLSVKMYDLPNFIEKMLILYGWNAR